MKFGEPTPDRTVTADIYMVGGGHNGPPPGKIGLKRAHFSINMRPILKNLLRAFTLKAKGS